MFIRSEQTVEVQFIHFDSVSHSVTLLPLHCELAPADKTHREPTENTSHGLILKVRVCVCVSTDDANKGNLSFISIRASSIKY